MILPLTGTLKGASFEDDVGKFAALCCEGLLLLHTYMTIDEWNKKNTS